MLYKLSKAIVVLMLGSIPVVGVAGGNALANPEPTNSSARPYRSIPAPEQLQAASAIAFPVNGRINVRIQNLTNAAVSYEVVGQTSQRTLPGRAQYSLRNLPAPATLTFRRSDGGLLRIQPYASAIPGQLDVILTETSDFNQDRISMRIQQNGAVYLN
jgi:hypothetical protein